MIGAPFPFRPSKALHVGNFAATQFCRLREGPLGLVLLAVLPVSTWPQTPPRSRLSLPIKALSRAPGCQPPKPHGSHTKVKSRDMV
mmetsp:Transcript_10205/g.34024  ORF Transcript_10205/g.34024 Transcript_10205/m.34024 type:complete len:86 (-) Transcript_10205:316-573(-)